MSLAPAVAFAALSLGSTPAGADTSDTVTLTPSADTFTNTGHAGTAYGATADLRAGHASGSTKIAYLTFTVPADDVARVAKATLTLTRTSHHLPSTTVSASPLGASWSEKTITAANAPKPGATVATTSVSSATTSLTLDVTKVAQGSTVSLALTSPTGGVAIFNSSESGANGPKLTLTLNPPVATPPTTTPPTTTPPTTTPPTTTPPTTTPPTTTPPTTTPPTTTPPTTTPPTTTPPTTTPPTTSSPQCSVSAILVSSCQVWLGDTPQAYSHSILSQAARLPIDEAFSGRKFDIFHEYMVNGQLFPDAASIAVANAGRILSINWKPATDMTWAQVAAGGADARIDAEAAYLKQNFTLPFFLTIYHEPEDNVINTPGSGMTPADYVAMYRHTVLRLRADGVHNFVTVMNYMGYWRWNSMRDALYPGDDVVDWIAWDPYQFNPGSGAGQDFAGMVNIPHAGDLGMYDWAVQNHPGKPLMLAEWGAYDDKLASAPGGPAAFYGTVASELAQQFPAIKAIDHFTMNPVDVAAGSGTSPTETAAGLLAWQQMVQNPIFNGPAISYANNQVVTNN